MPLKCSAAMSRVNHVVFLSSSMLCYDPIHFDNISGDFINFRCPPDTFYEDPTPYAVPTDIQLGLAKGFQILASEEHKRSGASAYVGLIIMPTNAGSLLGTDCTCHPE